MKRFNTKKDLLRYLGKNEDDRKLVTRMIERGEVRLEWRVYIIERSDERDEGGTEGGGRMQVSDVSSDLANDLTNRLSSLSNDLEYLNLEYEKLEGLLDYSLRKCYGIMKKNGLVGSEDTYDDFYENITAWYSARITEWYSAKSVSVAHTTEGSEALKASETGNKSDLNSVIQKFGISKASDFIS